MRRFVLAMMMGALVWGADDVFLAKPYLQLGDSPKLSKQEKLWVVWHAPDRDSSWLVEYRAADSADWRKAQVSLLRTVAVTGVPAHRVYGALLKDLPAGKEVRYRISVEGSQVFEAAGVARKGVDSPYRFAVFGDTAQGTDGQKQIIYQTFQAKPDFAVVTGDIVYSRGLISEYREKYFPIFNSDSAEAKTGAPLIRSTLFLAAPGNHDVGGADLGTYADGLAYFYYWLQPLNGPLSTPADEGVPPLRGAEARTADFRKAAGKQFPRMANFSFDYGNSHWTVMDSNFYADWTLPKLAEWLKKDLEAAKGAKWRFVAFHHPGFNSSKAHFKDQWMRLLAPVFEAGKVDLVFAGHVHNYQRSHPLRFVPEQTEWKAEVAGKWMLDRKYDGAGETRPDGPIYIVTGGGGARLYNEEQTGRPGSWQEFTAKFVSNVNSLTVADVDGGKLTVRQLDTAGREVDRFVITK